MDFTNQLILLIGVLFLLCVLASTISARLGLPLLLVFLALGMLAGEDGPGGIRFDDVQTTYMIGTVALVVILFNGGLCTDIGSCLLYTSLGNGPGARIDRAFGNLPWLRAGRALHFLTQGAVHQLVRL